MNNAEKTTLFYSEIGNRVREARKRNGWSQEMLAEKAELSAVTIFKIEKGQSGFYAYTLVKVAEALELSVTTLLFGNSEQNTEQLHECLEKASRELTAEQLAVVCAVVETMIQKFRKPGE